jgi:hypothetical protein
MPDRDKKISSTECDELCLLIQNLVVVSSEIRDSDNDQPPVLDDSYVTDTAEPLSREDLKTMVSNWITI